MLLRFNKQSIIILALLMKEYNIKIQTLELNLIYFGFRWKHWFLAKKNYNKNAPQQRGIFMFEKF